MALALVGVSPTKLVYTPDGDSVQKRRTPPPNHASGLHGSQTNAARVMSSYDNVILAKVDTLVNVETRVDRVVNDAVSLQSRAQAAHERLDHSIAMAGLVVSVRRTSPGNSSSST